MCRLRLDGHVPRRAWPLPLIPNWRLGHDLKGTAARKVYRYRSAGRPSAGQRAYFGVFPGAVRSTSGPEGRLTTRKPQSVRCGRFSAPVRKAWGGKATTPCGLVRENGCCGIFSVCPRKYSGLRSSKVLGFPFGEPGNMPLLHPGIRGGEGELTHGMNFETKPV